MERIAIAMVHGHAGKWLQTAVHSLKKYPNLVANQIFIATTWPGHPSIKAVMETDLGEDITVIECKRRLYSHATGLDEILEHLLWLRDQGVTYDYMFAMETDCVACEIGWLDWFHSFLKENENKGMAGFFWHEGNNHYNINPSGTLYRVSMLEKYHKEVRNNKEGIFWHPRGNKADTEGGMDPTIKEVAGVFSETRGIKDPNPAQLEAILKGIPQASWFEPGSWLYYRSLGEYESISVPCDHIYMPMGSYNPPEGTYYGGKQAPKFIHYWGGTRAWDHLKHPVSDNFVKSCSPHWIEREHNIWRSTVPEKYHPIIHSIYDELKLKGLGRDGEV